MFQKLFFNWLASMIGGRLDGKKLKVGGVLLFLYGLIEVLQKIFPDQVPNVPVQLSAENWDIIISYFKDGLAAFGVGVAGVGAVHKVYKEGVNTPAPTAPIEPPQEEKGWDGKVGGQFR